MPVLGKSLYSVKCSDVTRWKQGYITPPPPYFILWNAVTSLCENKVIEEPSPLLHCISQLGEKKGGQGHQVSQNSFIWDCVYEWWITGKEVWYKINYFQEVMPKPGWVVVRLSLMPVFSICNQWMGELTIIRVSDKRRKQINNQI